MARKQYEIRSFRNALNDYLGGLGWVGLDFREGFKSDKTIIVPGVAVRFLPGTKQALQLGGKNGEDLNKRIVQVDCYMESEDRAGGITDDVMDFIELETVVVKDPSNNVIGTLICQDDNSIYSDVQPPLLTAPTVLQWRGIIRATLESHTYAP